MEIEFENIGFIKSGKIETNNITIIFGPNNVCKTYLSYSTYAAISKYNAILKEKIKIPDSVSGDLVLNGVAKYDIANVFTDGFIKSVNDELSSKLPAFFKNSSEMFKTSKIRVIDSHIKDRVVNAEVNINVSVSENIILNIKKEKNSTSINFSLVSSKNNNEAGKSVVNLKEKDASDHLNILFNFFFVREILDSAANSPFIITSERTGISLFQKEIDGNRSNIVDSYMWNKFSGLSSNEFVWTFDDIMNKKVAKFSEPINHNINIIRNFSGLNEKTAFMTTRANRGRRSSRKSVELADIIRTLESLTGGQYSPSDGDTIFIASCGNGGEVSMPLSMSSASNKALFLLDIYIRYYLSNDSYLIIDEPELNLHPHNQIKMAELLVRLSNYGVKIIITTHSDYIVKEINNRIMASQLKDRAQLDEFGYKKSDVIKPSEVNGFTIDNDGIIREVKGNKYGVNAFIFDNAISDIENRTERLYTYLEGGF